MELQLIGRLVRRRWWLMLIPVVVVAAITLPDLLRDDAPSSAGYTTRITYSAAQALNLPERDGDYQDVWLASELTVNAFTDWVRSGRFREDMAEVIERDVNLAALSIFADNVRSIGVITLVYPTAEGLEAASQAAIEVLQTRNQRYFPQLGGDPAQVTILDQPRIAPAPLPLTNRFEPLLRLAAALAVGIALAVLIDYLDPTLRARDELERVGIPVLGDIPRYRA